MNASLTDIKEFPDLSLPPLTILCGLEGSGRRRLCLALEATQPFTQGYSLYAPLREAVRGMFFEGDPDLNLKEETVNLPGIDWNSNSFMNELRKHLQKIHGDTVLAAMLFTHLTVSPSFASMPERAIIEDGNWDNMKDLKYIVDKFGSENSLIVNVSVSGSSVAPLNSNRVKVVTIEAQEKGVDMLWDLHGMLGGVSDDDVA